MGLEEALILLYLLVDDAYRIVTGDVPVDVANQR